MKLSWLALLAAFVAPAPVTKLEDLRAALKEADLDPENCFRVRDFTYRRNEARFYLTEGALIFRKPVNGVRTAAVFIASEEVDDAEVVLIPPNRMERRSLASFTSSPNLNEHFRAAIFLFTDGTGERWLDDLTKSETARRSPERGVLLAERWNPTLRNLTSSLETRLLQDLLNGGGPGKGFFFAAISGTTLGNFDLYFDPLNREELLLGQLGNVDGHSRYNFWAHFEPKRSVPRVMPPPPAKTERYQVKAVIGPDLTLRARVTMTLRVNEDRLAVLPFELSPRMRIKSALWNGQPVEVHQREALRANLLRNAESEVILLRPPAPLMKGDLGTLEVEEEGDVFFRAGNGVLYLAARATWFPQMQFQAAPFEASFEHPKALTLVCPGARGEIVEAAHKLTTCKVERPVRLFGFNLGDFASAGVKRGGFEVEVYANRQLESALAKPASPIVFAPPMPAIPRRRIELPVLTLPPPFPAANPLGRLPEMAEEIAGALEFFSGILGPPPLNRIVAAPIPGSFGQGFPGFLYLSTLAYLEDRNLPAAERAEWQGRGFRDILQAHEVAHQWWGNQVSFDNYRDEWLSEGLANYSALLYLEKRKGAKAVEAVLEEYKRRLIAEDQDGNTLESAGPLVYGLRLRYSNPKAWQAVTYEKSSWMLHMLRGRVGDANFLKALGRLSREYSAKPLTTEDLRRTMASYLPKDAPDPDLDNLFETYVYGTGVPRLEMTSTVKGIGPKARVTIRLKQTKVGDDFAADIPVEIQLPRGQRMVKWIRSAKDEETVEVATGAAPLKVLLDPRNLVLKR